MASGDECVSSVGVCDDRREECVECRSMQYTKRRVGECRSLRWSKRRMYRIFMSVRRVCVECMSM